MDFSSLLGIIYYYFLLIFDGILYFQNIRHYRNTPKIKIIQLLDNNLNQIKLLKFYFSLKISHEFCQEKEHLCFLTREIFIKEDFWLFVNSILFHNFMFSSYLYSDQNSYLKGNRQIIKKVFLFHN